MISAYETIATDCQAADDAVLATRWQNGDSNAGSALLDRHLPRLRAFLAARCGNAVDADDLAQEVFLAVCRTIHVYDRQLPFTGWLYGIARHKLTDFWRRAPQPPQTLQTQAEPMESRSPADIHQQAENAVEAWKEVFRRLPEAQAGALWLRVQEEFSVEEIAETLKVSVANVKVLLFRARQTLTPFFKQRSQTR